MVRIFRIGILHCMVLVLPTTVLADDLTADAFLTKYVAASGWSRSALIVGKTETVVTGYVFPGQTTHCQSTYQIASDGKRWALRVSQFPCDSEGKALERGSESHSYVFSPTEQYRLIATTARPASAAKPLGALAYQEVPMAEARKTELQESSDLDGPLNGYVGGTPHATFVDLVISAENRGKTREEVIDGLRCVVISASTPQGQVSIWMAPDRDYNALRWSLKKVGSDKFAAGLLSDQKYPDPESPLISWEATLDNVSLAQVDGHWIAMDGTYHVNVEASDRRTQTCTYRIHRSAVTLNPDFDKDRLFAVDIPDGTRIGYAGLISGIAYEWKEGRAVPAMPSESIRSIDHIVDGINDGDAHAHRSSSKMASTSPAVPSPAAPELGHLVSVTTRWLWLGVVVGVAIAVLIVRRMIRRRPD